MITKSSKEGGWTDRVREGDVMTEVEAEVEAERTPLSKGSHEPRSADYL